jgi:vancomycin permeability regulator SanA
MFRKKGGEKRQRHYNWRGLVLLAGFCGALLLWGPTVYVNLATRHYRYELSRVAVADVPKRDVAIVLGAALRNNGTEPSSYLRWRVQTAVKLYKNGQVEKLLMSGDGSYVNHDEPAVMQQLAVDLGVPKKDIMLDKFGFDTYDSCSRAKKFRNISSAIMVTQGYHLPRAVYSCRQVGIDAIGVNAESKPQQGWTPYAIAREWLSTDKLFVQLALHRARNSIVIQSF